MSARKRLVPKPDFRLERLEDRSTPAVIFSQNFDTTAVNTLPAGWVASFGTTGAAPNWTVDNALTPTPVADTGANSVRVDDPGSTADKRLTSPTVNIPNSPGTQLRFRHNYSFETNWDGGVLEIAIGSANISAGTFTDIVTAGGSFASGDYTHTINSSANPLSARRGWSASSGGVFTTALVNLPAAAQGQPVQFRWRMGSDGSVAGLGWRVDTVQVGTPNLTLFSGNNQSVRVLNTFAQPVTAQVLGEFGGTPVSGITVTFTAVPGGGGASATFPSGNTAVTDATGAAGVTVAANAIVGAFTVRATVTGLGTVTFNLTNLPNQAPTGVSAGGPYVVQTGQLVTFTAAATDPENDPITYSWDLNGDGVFGDAVGKTVVRSTAQLASIGVTNGFTTGNLKVRVTDSFTASTTSAATSFTYQNQAPVGVTNGGPYTAVVGNPVTFTATAADPDGDVLKYQWDINGDGVFGDASGNTVTLTAAELSALGISGGFSTANLKVRVLDPFAGATDSAATNLTITLTPPVPPPPPPTPTKLTAVAAGPGGGPHVQVFNADGTQRFSFFAYDPGFGGGLTVATGDVTGDGVDDFATGTMAGGGPHVKIFNGATGAEIVQFFAYDPGFLGGLTLALGDTNGDGKADLITGVGSGGGPHVKVFDGVTGALISDFFAFNPAFTGGVNVAAGDLNGDGKADIVVGAGVGGGPNVRVYDGGTGALLRDFFAFNPTFTGGVTVAAADLTRDGKAEIFVGMATGGNTISLRDGATGGEMMTKVLGGYVGGVRVALRDLVGTGVPSPVVATGPGQPSLVQVLLYNGDVFKEFAPYDPSFLGGVSIG